MDKLFVLVDGNTVYRKTPKHWLKVSPYAMGEDRRLSDEELTKHKYKKLKTSVAYNIINRMFASFAYEWSYKKDRFKIKNNKNSSSCLDSPIHYFNDTPYRLVWRNGTLYWLHTYLENIEEEYYHLYEFKNNISAPGTYIGEFQLNTIKPVYKLVNNEWKLI